VTGAGHAQHHSEEANNPLRPSKVSGPACPLPASDPGALTRATVLASPASSILSSSPNDRALVSFDQSWLCFHLIRSFFLCSAVPDHSKCSTTGERLCRYRISFYSDFCLQEDPCRAYYKAQEKSMTDQ
jgi:hypothetical protein